MRRGGAHYKYPRKGGLRTMYEKPVVKDISFVAQFGSVLLHIDHLGGF